MGERLEGVETEIEKFKEREVKFETGVVKHFHRDNSMGMGKIYPDLGGGVISFHLVNYRQFHPGIDVPQFVQESNTRLLSWDEMPSLGTKVVFARKGKGAGIRASPWGFKDEFDNMASQMQTLPLYRLRNLTSGKTDWFGRDENGPIISHHEEGVFEVYENGKWEWFISAKPRKK